MNRFNNKKEVLQFQKERKIYFHELIQVSDPQLQPLLSQLHRYSRE